MPGWLRQRAHLTPDRLALVASGQRLTFAELDRRVDELAAELGGVTGEPEGLKGERVAVLMGNSARYVELVHALARRGAILVPLNTRLTADELGWQIDDCGAALLAHDEAHAAGAAALRAQRPTIASLELDRSRAELSPGRGVSRLAGRPEGVGSQSADAATTLGSEKTSYRERAATTPGPETQTDSVDLEALHSIVYTSGTTGRPKGALLTYGNHWWSAVGSALNLGLLPDDRWLAPLPLFHVGGLSILVRSVVYGIPAIVLERFDEGEVNRAIDRERATIVSVVAAMLQRMLVERGDRPYPPWLRCVLLGGGPAPRPLLEECARRDVPVVQTYGLTEAASQVATLAPEDALRKLGSAGKPLMPTELRIDRGEILVRGPTISPGYWNRRSGRDDGWLRTGDLGRLDDEGYLYVLDRRDDLIVSGGENVYPAEVEAVLLAHPLVEEAAVVGRHDERWGAVPVAFVRAVGDVSTDELRAFCRERLAAYKVPGEIRLVEALPRNAAGKLLRRELRP
jgi:O-succinylbenzoic acid--CoA ligase